MRTPTAAPGTWCRPPCHAPRRPGNVLILFAVLLTSLVGMVAFAIDTGYIALYKTRMQRAADAAALAGAQKALVVPGQSQDPAAVRSEVRKYIDFNMPGLTVRDEDIKLCRYTPYYAPGSRLSYTYSVSQPANAVQVTLRRDGVQNNPLELFFAPVIGSKSTALSVTSTAYCAKGRSVKPGAPLLPYTMQIDYYYAAMGQPRPGGSTGLLGNLLNTIKNLISDLFTVNPNTLQVLLGPDGINEVILFCDTQNTPGNFGSLDIGSNLNSTGELERQIVYGPTEADFANPDFVFKVNPADGALYVPFAATGDTGMSTSVKSSFEAIKGQPRIIPLYDTVGGSGDGSTYQVVGYAGVVITKVEFTGSPKKVQVQPAFVVSNKVTPATSDTDVVVEGVYMPPKLVIP
jgi:Flp pilus assembly protein TadG